MTTPPGAVASGEAGEEGNLEENRTTMRVELHPLCEIFPRLSSTELDDLAGDIKLNGLHQSIVLLDGMILDGGNRYAACIKAGVKPLFVEYDGGNPAAFVLSMNLHRRHLPIGQYATIVSLAQDWSKAQGHGGDRKADQGATLHFDSVSDRAAQSGASERTQKMADKVAKAAPELAKQVAHGEISLPEAVRQVEKKPDHVKVVEPAPTVEPDPDDDPHGNLIADLEREVAENRVLQQRVNVLTANDQTAKLNEWMTKFYNLDAHLTQVNTTLAIAQKQARYQGGILSEIRKHLAVERDRDILPKLKGGAK